MAGPPTAVVDASVAAKWFLPERDSEAVLALRDEHVAGRIRLVAPALLPYETANALRYHPQVGSGFLAVHIADLFALAIRFDPVSDLSLAQAVETAYQTGLTVYDVCYISSEEHLDCPLLTADETQLEASGPRGRQVRDWPSEGL